ncbi:MAG: TAXI family TRAP transporter solute-binding subunit [Methyloligellaceae bacterium]
MKQIILIALTAVLALVLPAQGKDLIKMSTLGPGSSPNLVMTTFATIINKQSHGNIEIQVNATGTAPKHAIEAASGKVDLFMYAPIVHHFMKQRKAMFTKVKKAPELAKKLRGVLSFPIGVYHFTVYEESGIKSLKDIKGKKVFLGPPVGAASVIAAGVIKAVTGYEAGKDYTAVKLGWGPAAQAFQDRQLDIYVNPTNAPSPVIQQVALSHKLRFLGLSEKDLKNEEVIKLYKRPGGKIGVIPAGTYGKNQMNDNDVTSIAAIVGVGVGKHVPTVVVYSMTKAFWENIESETKGAPWLRAVKIESAFDQMNLPLHPGAYLYYKKRGLDIPEKLKP